MAEIETKDEAPAKPSMLPKLMIFGFVSTVVIAETFIFFFLVPSADDVAALAEARLIEKVEASMEADGDETVEDENKIEEFALGSYGIIFVPPGTDRKHRVEFELFGLVKGQDQAQVEKLFEERQGRFRDRMLAEVRNATMDDLEQLDLIKRRIFATSNEILESPQEKPLLQGVGFKNYIVAEE